jgi:osmoprotectant transport system permease protein
VPCIKQSTLNKYPELKQAVNSLSPYLTEKAMMKMNYEVDEEGREPADVAKSFLQEKGLI